MSDLTVTRGSSAFVSHSVLGGKRARPNLASANGGAIDLTFANNQCFNDGDRVLVSLQTACGGVYEYGVVSNATNQSATVTTDSGEVVSGTLQGDGNYLANALNVESYKMVISVFTSDPTSVVPTAATATVKPLTRSVILQNIEDCEAIAGDRLVFPGTGFDSIMESIKYKRTDDGIIALAILSDVIPGTLPDNEPLSIEIVGRLLGQYVSNPAIADAGYFRGQIPSGLIETLKPTFKADRECDDIFIGARYSAAIVLGAEIPGGNRPIYPAVQLAVASGFICVQGTPVNIPNTYLTN